MVAGEGHHGVFAGAQRITEGAVGAADRPDMLQGDGPVGQRGRGLGQDIAQGAGGVDPPPGMTGRGAGGLRQPVPGRAMPGQLRPAAGIKRREGFGLDRGQLLGDGVYVQDRAFQLGERPFRRVHPQ